MRSYALGIAFVSLAAGCSDDGYSRRLTPETYIDDPPAAITNQRHAVIAFRPGGVADRLDAGREQRPRARPRGPPGPADRARQRRRVHRDLGDPTQPVGPGRRARDRPAEGRPAARHRAKNANGTTAQLSIYVDGVRTALPIGTVNVYALPSDTVTLPHNVNGTQLDEVEFWPRDLSADPEMLCENGWDGEWNPATATCLLTSS